MFKYLRSVMREASIRNRIFFVLAILLITRILSIIPIPSVSGKDLASFVNDNQFLGMLNIFSGGGLSSMSYVMLGVQPYITASIIMQLVAVLYPKLKEMQQEEGEIGRRKYAKYTRWLTPPLALLQAAGLLTLFVKQGVIDTMTKTDFATNIIIIMAGSMLMMWLGEVINEKGIGNGISLIIFSGIIATLPAKIWSIMGTVDHSQLPMYIALLITFVLVLMGIVAVTEAERPIEVTYAKQSRGYASAGLTTTYLPLRLTQAGVVPVIFAVSLMAFPQMTSSLMASSQSATLQLFANKIAMILGNQWIYGVIYFALIVMFTFFYTMVTFDPIKTSENLQKSGAFIPGHRPGEATTEYISTVLMRTTTVGALFLGLVALLPIILSGLTGVQALSVGGTSLLIAISVIIDLMKKIDAQLTMREY
jgi:preprotein translocase subunit SecY